MRRERRSVTQFARMYVGHVSPGSQRTARAEVTESALTRECYCLSYTIFRFSPVACVSSSVSVRPSSDTENWLV